MKNKKFFTAILILAAGLIAISKISYSQQEGDRIIAIVGNQIILESDLQYQVQLYMRQNQMAQLNPAMINQLFQQLINEKIIIAKAEQDSIEIKPEEISKELDYRLKSLLEQYGSEERIEEIYGMSLGKIRLLLREDLSNKMKSERMKRKKFPGGVKVTEREVRDFYRTYGDSLPMASDEYEISHIFIMRNVTEDEKKLAYEKALLIMDSIKQGIDFGELAKRNSSDEQSAAQNGDLGYAKKGIFVKEFEDELFSLNEPGDISQIVETQYGYHIIKLTDKRGDQRRSSHILIPFPKLESNDFQTIALLKDIKEKILSFEITFEEAAKKYSQEESTKDKDGYLGFIAKERLDSNIIDALDKLSPNEITDPVRIGDDENYGYEIVKLISINPAHIMTLETDYDKIRRFAEFEKETVELNKWIEELKKSIYVDIKF
ncbi:MAG: peptidylprolyl isomerase [Ignavibacteria bacterium]|nr:peptidylprolyl isomerase [Ignavibacteria bacterium]